MENTGKPQETSTKVIELAKRLKALAETGLLYAQDQYNIDRYSEISDISDELFSALTIYPVTAFKSFYLPTGQYPTPKADVRAVVFNERNEMLFVREKSDNKWALPGGWADIGYSPAEVAVKEVAEETGLTVKPIKLLAVLDKKNFPHPPEPEYVYKHFILCEISGGKMQPAHDISEVAFFPVSAIPELSEIRVVKEQVTLMFSFLKEPDKQAVFQ